MTLQSHDEAPSADDSATPTAGLTGEVASLTHELRGLVHDQLQLAALETRQCINSLLITMVIAVMTGLLLVSTWVGVVGAVLLALVRIGLAPLIAILLLVSANLLAAAVCWTLIQRRVDALGWPKTLRTLGLGPESDSEGDTT